MFVTTECAQDQFEQTRRQAHPHCIVCGHAHDRGLGLHFRLCDDGSVQAEFTAGQVLQGYQQMLHGGVSSTLMDGAMTNCLFAHGIIAVTAELLVRFRHPIELEFPLVVRAHITRSQSPLYVVDASIEQAGQLRATATGKFMDRSYASATPTYQRIGRGS